MQLDKIKKLEKVVNAELASKIQKSDIEFNELLIGIFIYSKRCIY